jgi:hypothetical protein
MDPSGAGFWANGAYNTIPTEESFVAPFPGSVDSPVPRPSPVCNCICNFPTRIGQSCPGMPCLTDVASSSGLRINPDESEDHWRQDQVSGNGGDGQNGADPFGVSTADSVPTLPAGQVTWWPFNFSDLSGDFLEDWNGLQPSPFLEMSQPSPTRSAHTEETTSHILQSDPPTISGSSQSPTNEATPLDLTGGIESEAPQFYHCGLPGCQPMGTARSLQRHLEESRAHHSSLTPPFICRCSASLKRWDNFKTHIRKTCSSAPPNSTDYICKCGDQFPDADSIELHYKQIHEGRKGRPSKTSFNSS